MVVRTVRAKNKRNVNIRHVIIRNCIYRPYCEVTGVELRVPGCEWVGAIHPPPLCTCLGVSCVDRYYCEVASIER